MKKAVILLACILISLSAVSAYEVNLSSTAVDTVSYGSNLQVTSLRYDPYPAEPGETIDVWIRLTNIGRIATKEATCRFVTDSVFSLYQGDEVQSYGVLGSGDQAVFQYKIKISESTVEGTNELKIECSDDSASFWKQTKLPIKVQTRYSTLNVANVMTEPYSVSPGSNAKLLITLENRAASSMRDITAKLDFSSVPIVAYGELGDKKIKTLGPGSSEDLVFNIIALPTADGGIYKLPVQISYTNDAGTAYNVNGSVAMIISSKPDLYISIDSTTITKDSKTGKIILKIVNKGLTDLKFFTVQLPPSKQYKVISSPVEYIGDIDSNDFETAEFRITAKKNSITLPLEMEYRDTSNQKHSEQMNITFTLMSNSEMGTGSGFSIVGLLLVLGALYFGYRKREWIKEKFKKIFKR